MDRGLRWAIAAAAAGVLLSCLLFGASLVLAAPPTVSLTANPSVGAAPLNTTLSWSSSGAVSCSANGAWTGTKPLNGSQSFTGLLADTLYGLTCKAADGTATLTWVIPVNNVDGSPLLDLAAHEVTYAAGCTALDAGTNTTIIPGIPAASNSIQISSLPAGGFCAYVKAVNASGIKSVPSNNASKTVSVSSTSRSVTVDIVTQPSPPSTLTIAMEVFDLKVTGPRYALNKNVGTIAIGQECGALRVSNSKGNFYEVSPDLVHFTTGNLNSAVVVAKCGAA